MREDSDIAGIHAIAFNRNMPCGFGLDGVSCNRELRAAYRNIKSIKMKNLKNTILPIVLAPTWISFSEFVRNEFLLKNYWTDPYEKSGLIFPSGPINGVVRGLWSLCFAMGIYVITKKFSLFQTTAIAWFMGFVLMWIATGNMSVLPFGILVLPFR